MADQRVSICFTRISIVSVDRLNQSGTFMAFRLMIAASKSPCGDLHRVLEAVQIRIADEACTNVGSQSRAFIFAVCSLQANRGARQPVIISNRNWGTIDAIELGAPIQGRLDW
jgi:hypothetical protein